MEKSLEEENITESQFNELWAKALAKKTQTAPPPLKKKTIPSLAAKDVTDTVLPPILKILGCKLLLLSTQEIEKLEHLWKEW